MNAASTPWAERSRSDSSAEPADISRRTIPVLEELRRLPAFLRDYAGDSLGHHQRRGDVFHRRLGSPSLNLGHPRLVKQVLRSNVRNYIKNHHYRFLEPLLGQGIFVSEGELWARQRRLLAPEFRAKEVARFLPVVNREIELVCADWDASVSEGAIVDINAAMMNMTLCVIGGAMFKADFRPHADAIGEVMDTCLRQGTRAMLSMGLLQPWMPTPGNRRAHAARVKFDQIILSLIAEGRADTPSH